MKKLIYRSIVFALLLLGNLAVHAQGDIDTGSWQNEPSRCCKCFLPLKIPAKTGFECYSLPLIDPIDCENLNFESSSYFSGWRGKWGPLCRHSFVQIDETFDFATIQKDHGDLYRIIDNTSPANDPYVGFPTRSPLGGNQAVRIGDDDADAYGTALGTTVRVQRSDPKITLLYAFVLGICPDIPHDPFFSIHVTNRRSSSLCTEVATFYYSPSTSGNIPGIQFTSTLMYKDWTAQVIDLSNFFVSSSAAYEDFSIQFLAGDCSACGHNAHAYVDVVCNKKVIITQPEPHPDPVDPNPEPEPIPDPDPNNPFIGMVKCTGANITFSALGGAFANETYSWDFGDGKGWSTEREPTYFYSAAGIYNVVLKTTTPFTGLDLIDTIRVKIIDCCSLENVPKIKPEDCITSFSPVEGETYILHAWVKEDVSDPNTDSRIITYAKGTPHIGLTFYNESDGSPVYESCFPSGPIIDGWQRIEKEFTIPSCPSNGKINMDITLNGLANDIDEGTYFDDIRIFPKKGGMKSFVYDPASQKLLAELDEENFATFYEYDQEGALIRVKKETERGIKTLKEAGNNTKKP